MAEIKPDNYVPSSEIKPEVFEIKHGEQETLVEVPVNTELHQVIKEQTPIFNSPEGLKDDLVENTLEQFDHAAAVNDKKEEAVQLEKLLADDHDEILSFAMETQEDANKFGGEIKTQ